MAFPAVFLVALVLPANAAAVPWIGVSGNRRVVFGVGFGDHLRALVGR
ncbi:MAG: hypothetical protein JST31_00025 [Actinobacteria bacterium]|nr:hypothetical protein [Actinomycetota bacterium]